MDGISLRELKVNAVKNILFVAFVMYGRDLRRIKKASAVQPVNQNKVAPLVPAVSQVESGIGRAKTSISRREIAVRNFFAQARARCNVDDHACLLAELCWWRAGDYFKR